MAETLSYWEALLLGVVQGLTEWLPVSSSGHLVLTQELFGTEAPLIFELLVHLGTLSVVLHYYRAEVAAIVVAWLKWPEAAREEGGWGAALRADEHRFLGALVILGTIPTVVIGFAFRDTITALFGNLLAVGVALICTGLLLVATMLVRPPGEPGPIQVPHAFAVGAMQGLAIVPGISRSGATIGTALLLGRDREQAARFSFLLFIPAIIGATVLQATPSALAGVRADWGPYLVGFLAAVIVGYLTLAFLVRIVKSGGLHRFAPYCLIVGASAVAWALVHAA